MGPSASSARFRTGSAPLSEAASSPPSASQRRARGGTPVAFLIGGALALITAYSYIGLTLRYPGPGGTVSFVTKAFGTGLLAASINVLLVLNYVAIMSVYASALASYSLPYVPEHMRPVASHVIASTALILLALINYAGSALVERSEGALNAGKLSVLGLFIVVGLFASGVDWGGLRRRNGRRRPPSSQTE
jgi:amino acid transporter